MCRSYNTVQQYLHALTSPQVGDTSTISILSCEKIMTFTIGGSTKVIHLTA